MDSSPPPRVRSHQHLGTPGTPSQAAGPAGKEEFNLSENAMDLTPTSIPYTTTDNAKNEKMSKMEKRIKMSNGESPSTIKKPAGRHWGRLEGCKLRSARFVGRLRAPAPQPAPAEGSLRIRQRAAGGSAATHFICVILPVKRDDDMDRAEARSVACPGQGSSTPSPSPCCSQGEHPGDPMKRTLVTPRREPWGPPSHQLCIAR